MCVFIQVAYSVSTVAMNPVICMVCVLNMTEILKIQRNIGSKHKGSSIELCEHVLHTWKELALPTDSRLNFI